MAIQEALRIAREENKELFELLDYLEEQAAQFRSSETEQLVSYVYTASEQTTSELIVCSD
jgi:hypothetical protein